MARFFNGGSDIITASPVAVSLRTVWSISCWFKLLTAPASTEQFFFNGNSAANGFGFAFNGATSTPSLLIATVSFIPSTLGNLTLGTWYNLVATENSGYIMYQNGVQAFAFQNPGQTPAQATVSLIMGASCNCVLADCAIWDATLTAAEAFSLSQGARPSQIRPQSLLYYAPLTGLQSPEPDLSSKNNSGTVTGTANASNPPLMLSTRQMPTPPPSVINWMSRQFNGANDQMVASVPLIANNLYANSFWIYPTAFPTGGGQSYIFAAGDFSSNGYAMYIAASGVLHFIAFGQFDLGGSQSLNVNAWNHIAFSSDIANNGTVYVNGVSTLTFGSGFRTPANPFNITIIGSNAGLPARIAHFAQWHGINGGNQMPVAMVTALNQGASPLRLFGASALQAYWPMNGLQDPEPDFSSLKVSSTLTGTFPAAGPPVMMFTPRQWQTLPPPPPPPVLAPNLAMMGR